MKRKIAIFIIGTIFGFMFGFFIFHDFSTKISNDEIEYKVSKTSEIEHNTSDLKKLCGQLKKGISIEDFFKIFNEKDADQFTNDTQTYYYLSDDSKGLCSVTFMDGKLYSFVWSFN